MSSAISIPSNTSSHVVSGHLDHYSKTYSGHYKGKAGVDRGRHTSDHFDTVADHDSDSDEILDQVPICTTRIFLMYVIQICDHISINLHVIDGPGFSVRWDMKAQHFPTHCS